MKENDKRIKDNVYKIEDIKPLRLYKGKAEAMEDVISDEAHDVLTCGNLFSELPAEVRKHVVKEFWRVTKPGGIVCLADVIQNGDVKDQEYLETLGQNYQPVQSDFVTEDLNKLFFDAGFMPGPTTPIIASATKV